MRRYPELILMFAFLIGAFVGSTLNELTGNARTPAYLSATTTSYAVAESMVQGEEAKGQCATIDALERYGEPVFWVHSC